MANERESDHDFRQAILELLEVRGAEKTICPSELLPAAKKKNKLWMERVRRSALDLAKRGKVEITQKGKLVDLDAIRGPIRIRIPRK